MSDNSGCTVYVGNLDERVSDRVLYDILIQAGRLVDLYIPRDKETDKPKGYAFAEYETEEIADYAVRLFSGLVTLYKRTLKFAISGQDKPAQSASMTTTPGSNIPHKSRRYTVSNMDSPQHSVKVSPSCKVSAYASNYSQGGRRPTLTCSTLCHWGILQTIEARGATSSTKTERTQLKTANLKAY